jgi:Ca2+-binding RTX toxin-like protein
MVRLALVALAVALLATPAAQAATVTLRSETVALQDGPRERLHTLDVTAAAGEVNAAALELTAGVVTYRDVVATAGRGCAAVDPGTVRCVLTGGAERVRVDATLRLGDGDDRATITPARELLVTVFGGDGNDIITSPGITEGGPGDDTLTGTDGDEGLAGGPGNDTLRGLGGNDGLVGDSEPQDGTTGCPCGNDLLDGGPGRDSVIYSARRAPLVIDLTAGTAGQAGEQDRLVAIENAAGGRGTDRITGTDGANWLDAGGGRDTLIGLAGDDQLQGGADSNGGPGRDTIDFPRGRFASGAGTDTVGFGPPRPLPRDCERAALDPALTADARPVLRHGMVVVTLRSTCRCVFRGRMRVTRAGRTLASGRVRVGRAPRGGERLALAELPLTLAGVRAFARRITVTVHFGDATGRAASFQARLSG